MSRTFLLCNSRRFVCRLLRKYAFTLFTFNFQALESKLNTLLLSVLHPDHVNQALIGLVFAVNHLFYSLYFGSIQNFSLAVIARSFVIILRGLIDDHLAELICKK